MRSRFYRLFGKQDTGYIPDPYGSRRMRTGRAYHYRTDDIENIHKNLHSADAAFKDIFSIINKFAFGQGRGMDGGFKEERWYPPLPKWNRGWKQYWMEQVKE